MARVTKPESSNIQIAVREGNHQMDLVGRGQHAYVWVGMCEDGDKSYNKAIYTFSGRKTLRQFAEAILATIPAPKTRVKR
jgi:hypothetical protein